MVQEKNEYEFLLAQKNEYEFLLAQKNELFLKEIELTNSKFLNSFE